MSENTLYDVAEEIQGKHRRFGYAVAQADHIWSNIGYYKDLEENSVLVKNAGMVWSMVQQIRPSPRETVEELKRYEDEVPYVAKIREDLEVSLSALERFAKRESAEA